MTSLWQMPAVVVALLAWLASPPTSIADAARKETLRRQLTAKSTVVYSNENLPAARYSDIAEPVSDAAPDLVTEVEDETGRPTAASSTGAAPGAGVASGESAAPAGDEQAWRGRLAGLQNTLSSDELLAASLQTRASSLQNDFLSRDDPAQRAKIGQDLARTLAELDRMKLKVQADRAALDKLREDARRQGVPAGWVR